MKKLSCILAAALLLLSGCANAANASENPSSSEPESSATISESMAESVDLPLEDEPEQENVPAEQDDTLYIRLTFDGGEALVRLEDNVAARGWYAQLPMTLSFEEFHGREKICRLPDEISTGDMAIGNVPEVGDISLYIPWNTLVFYYDEYNGNDSSVPMGHVESGLELLAAMGDKFTVTMEPMSGAAAAEGPAIPQAEATDITMTVGDTVITATLDDSETSREFLATLPRTLSMNRYADREYYGQIEALSTSGEEIPDFSNGDVTLYVPGPSFAIFFANEEQSSLSGLIRMGRITSDLSEINALRETVEMLIQVVE